MTGRSVDTPVLLEVRDHVAHLTLNRPSHANAFDLETAESFAHAIDTIAREPSARAILLTGAGARFCAGGDVSAFGAADDGPAYIRHLAEVWDPAMQRLASLAKPVVAGVQGAVAGAGLSLMLAADVVVASRNTKFVTAYAGIGLTPDIGLSWLLPRAIGQTRALDLLLTGRVIDADLALDWGLVTEVTEQDAGERARAITQRLADTVPEALGQARRLVREGWSTTRNAAGRDETLTIATRVGSEEAKPLIANYVASRPTRTTEVTA